MKRQLKILITTSAVSAFAYSALAQSATTPRTEPDYSRLESAQDQNPTTLRTDRPDHARQAAAQERRGDRLNGAAKASELIGMDVKNYQDEKLGTVEDLGLDLESGRVLQVIVSHGGFIGIGSSLTALPPGALHHDTANEVLHLNADKAKLGSAPKFDADKWAESSTSNHLAAVYRHYGEEPAFNFIGQGETRRDGQRSQTDRSQTDRRDQTGLRSQDQRDQTGLRGQTDQRDQTGLRGQIDQRDQTGLRSQTDQRSQSGQYQTDPRLTDHAADSRNVGTRSNDQTWDQSNYTSTRHSMIPSERLGKPQRASKIIGMNVKNRQGETIGDVDNILVDVAAGRLVAVVISSGGFLGMGDELSVVPPTALQFSADRDSLQLDATKEQLSNAPRFKANQWPDFAQPEQAVGVYRAYQVEPYFATDATTDADNTGRNVRDRNDQTLTPMDQGNSSADIQMTASIRKGIRAADNMSVNAKNVKIITKDGRVTLRGPVDSAEEKRLIGEIANRLARAGNVDNQLEVKRTTATTSSSQ